MFRTLTTAVALCAVAATLSAQTPKTTSQSTAKPAPKPATVATTKAKPSTESQAALRREAKISFATARATALKEVPTGKVRGSKLERENGKLVYSFNIKVPGKRGIEEVNVDAVTGAVVSKELESAKTEAMEHKAEKSKK